MRLITITLCIMACHSYAGTPVDFRGTLVYQPCKIDDDSKEQTIDYGDVNRKDFIKNAYSRPKIINITFSDCHLQGIDAVAFTFDGRKDDNHSSMFALDGDAKGISLYIEDLSGRPVIPGVESVPYTLVEGGNRLSWNTFIYAPDYSLITQGEFYGLVNFTVRYL